MDTAAGSGSEGATFHARADQRTISPIGINGQAQKHNFRQRHNKVEKADVVVAGGGIAGLYTVYRLIRSLPGIKVILLEPKPWLGGRLNTSFVDVYGKEVKLEEGGMRFLKSHTHLLELIDSLGFNQDVVPFHMGDQNNLYYLNRHRFTRGDVMANPALWGKCYNLRDDEIGNSPADLLNRALKTVIDKNGDPRFWPSTPEDWQRVRNEFVWDQRPMNQWAFWPFLTSVGLSGPAIDMIFNAAGFQAPRDLAANAGAAFQLFGNFSDTPQFYTLTPGYQALPMKIAESLNCGGNVHIRTSSKLESFDHDGEHFALTVANGAGFSHEIACDALVLAMPTMGLDKLCISSPPLQRLPQFERDMQSVCMMKLAKINLGFEHRFWFTELGNTAGGCFTDLPLGQVYAFEPHLADLENGPAAMTVYCDSNRWEYWLGLQERGPAYRTSACPELPPHSKAASQPVVKAVVEQLGELFDTPIPVPVFATTKTWGQPGVGGGDHLWAVGCDDSVVAPRIHAPTDGLFVAGECFSDEQCWVEGGLRSAKRAADGVARYLER